MRKVITKNVSKVSTKETKKKPAGKKPAKVSPKGRTDSFDRFTPFTRKFNLQPAKAVPIKIEGKQGAGHGMRYDVTFPGADDSMGITRALMVMGFAGYDIKSIREVCNAAGQPEIRDSVIASFSGAGRALANGEKDTRRGVLTADELKIAKSKKLNAALAYYAKRIAK